MFLILPNKTIWMQYLYVSGNVLKINNLTYEYYQADIAQKVFGDIFREYRKGTDIVDISDVLNKELIKTK